jgi:hypothetical protein
LPSVGGAAVPRVEGFEDLVEIGRGGSGIVYAATQVTVGRRVAVKVLDLGAGGLRRVEREARALGSLSGISHVVQVFLVTSTDDGRPALVMSLMTSSVGTVVKDHTVVPMSRALEWLDQVAGALDAAHLRGIAHRDIKPENVLLSTEGEAYLADFGISVMDDMDISATSAMSFSPMYAPPERFTEEWSDPRAEDLYSMAATFYALLVRRPPFGTTTVGGLHGLISRVVSDPLPSDPGLSGQTYEVLARAMSKSPGDRPATAGLFAAELAGALGEQGALPSPPGWVLAATGVEGELRRLPGERGARPREDVERSATTAERRAAPGGGVGDEPTSEVLGTRSRPGRRAGLLVTLLAAAAVLVVAVVVGSDAWRDDREDARRIAAAPTTTIPAAESGSGEVTAGEGSMLDGSLPSAETENPASSESCPTLQTGTWTGSFSNIPAGTMHGDLRATVEVRGYDLTGELTIADAMISGGVIIGQVDCSDISMSFGDGSLRFAGTLSPDGTQIDGTYQLDLAGISDQGVFKVIRQ